MGRGFLLSVGLFSGLFVVAVAACAEGNTIDEPLAGGRVDAGRVEGSIPAQPTSDSGIEPEPGEDSGGKKDGGSTLNPACAAALAKASYNFEGDNQGWVAEISDGAKGSATWPFNPWTRGASTTLPCFDGQCFAAERDQNYAQCQRGEIISPKIDLKACASEKVFLVFQHAYAFWTDSYNGTTWFDGGIIEISADDAVSWNVPPATYPGTVKINPSRTGGYKCVDTVPFHVNNKSGFVQTQTTTTAEIAVPAAALTDKMRVRFSQASGVSSSTVDADTSRATTAAGWRIDDVHFIVK